MRAFLRAQEKLEADFQANAYAPFRQKFFFDSCQFGNRSRRMQAFASETISSTESNDKNAFVITERPAAYYKSGKMRLRYALEPVGAGWRIRSVARACTVCDGSDDPKGCWNCQGAGWE